MQHTTKRNFSIPLLNDNMPKPVSTVSNTHTVYSHTDLIGCNPGVAGMD